LIVTRANQIRLLKEIVERPSSNLQVAKPGDF